MTGITLDGVAIVDTAPSYMKPHGVPSSGDWALRRTAAVISSGAVNVSIQSCQFEKIDGNALLLTGYNRGVTVVDTEFAWIGGSAMVGWGSTDDVGQNGTLGFDATEGEFPRYTRIEHVTCREVELARLVCTRQRVSPHIDLVDWFVPETGKLLVSCKDNADHHHTPVGI